MTSFLLLVLCWISLWAFFCLLAKEFYGTQYQSGLLSLINVGSGIECLLFFSFFKLRSVRSLVVAKAFFSTVNEANMPKSCARCMAVCMFSSIETKRIIEMERWRRFAKIPDT